jgi:hypothetical protein
VRKNLIERERLFLTHLTVVSSLSLLDGFEIMNFTLYESALCDESLPRIPKDVLRYIIFRSNETNTCYFSQSKACKQLKYCRQQLSEAVSWLREHGYILTIARGRILTYDLSPYMTRRPHLSPNTTVLSSRATGTCRPERHRTSSELANERFDPNGLRYKVTVDGIRKYY